MSAEMPYTGGDAVEVLEPGGQVGNFTTEGGSLRRVFDVPGDKYLAFIYAMMGNASWLGLPSFIAKRADVVGMPSPDGVAIADAGSGLWPLYRITLGYEPTNIPSGGGTIGVTYERSLDFTETVISPPGDVWFHKAAAKGEKVQTGTLGKAIGNVRFVYSIKGLAAFSGSDARGYFGKVDGGAPNVKLSAIQMSQTFFANGDVKYNVTLGLDTREQDWRKFWIKETNTWDFYYLTEAAAKTQDATKKILIYDSADVLTWVAGFGVDVSDVV